MKELKTGDRVRVVKDFHLFSTGEILYVGDINKISRPHLVMLSAKECNPGFWHPLNDISDCVEKIEST